MSRRAFELLLLSPLFACASTSDVVRAPDPASLDLFTYHVVVPAVPAEASEVVLMVATAEAYPLALSLQGLVGNAPFEVPELANHTATALANEQVELSYSSVPHLVHTTWQLQATTHGKPLELDIRVAFPKGTTDVAALERALVECTAATCDGKPVDAVTTRLVRVR
jgi:hypothetical protein